MPVRKHFLTDSKSEMVSRDNIAFLEPLRIQTRISAFCKKILYMRLRDVHANISGLFHFRPPQCDYTLTSSERTQRHNLRNYVFSSLRWQYDTTGLIKATGCKTTLSPQKATFFGSMKIVFFEDVAISKSNKILSMLNCQLLHVGIVAIPKLKVTQVFHTSRINLSPFTKDFRVWGTPIEIQTYFSVGLRTRTW
jgi:hypothetical protein